jgi:hypothetical protein
VKVPDEGARVGAQDLIRARDGGSGDLDHRPGRTSNGSAEASTVSRLRERSAEDVPEGHRQPPVGWRRPRS